MKLIKKNKEAVKRSVLKIVQICIMLNSQKYDFFFFSFLYFLLLFNYNCPTFFQLLFLSAPPPSYYRPCILYNCFCKPFTLLPYNPLHSPLWSLSACSQFQCLWLYFACLFVLLIRFLLKVRSYDICLSLPGLFHLA